MRWRERVAIRMRGKRRATPSRRLVRLRREGSRAAAERELGGSAALPVSPRRNKRIGMACRGLGEAEQRAAIADGCTARQEREDHR